MSPTFTLERNGDIIHTSRTKLQASLFVVFIHVPDSSTDDTDGLWSERVRIRYRHDPEPREEVPVQAGRD
jgi:hypothetical protein